MTAPRNPGRPNRWTIPADGERLYLRKLSDLHEDGAVWQRLRSLLPDDMRPKGEGMRAAFPTSWISVLVGLEAGGLLTLSPRDMDLNDVKQRYLRVFVRADQADVTIAALRLVVVG